MSATIPQSDEPAMENGNKVSSMYHTSKELGIRVVHNPTRMEAVEHNLKTVEVSDFHNTENIKRLGKLIKTLIDQNTLQQELIDQNRVRIQKLEEASQ